MLGLDLGGEDSDDGEEFAAPGGGLGAVFGAGARAHTQATNKALQYRCRATLSSPQGS